MSVLVRNNVQSWGQGKKPMIFAHGLGCDQGMWRYVAPAFTDDFQVVLFDHVGSGRSDWSAFDPGKYGTLHGYSNDLIEICRKLELGPAVFVGHSVSAMIGVLAAVQEPSLFEELVLIGPSARYLDDHDYRGGFTRAQIDELLDFLDHNFLGWSTTMAPVIMGNPDRPALAVELADSFCRMDPEIAKCFAHVTFLSDNRADLSKVRTPSLVLQCRQDLIANEQVGRYVHRHLVDSAFTLMQATGHCPNLSAPEETIGSIKAFLGRKR